MAIRRATQRRRRSLPVVACWTSLLFVLAGVAAWKFDWVHFGNIGIATTEGHAPELAGQSAEVAQLPVDDMAGDPAVFSQQAEPAAGGTAYEGAGIIARAPKVPTERLLPSANLDNRTTTSMPGQFPSGIDARPLAQEQGQPLPTPPIGRHRLVNIDPAAKGVVNSEHSPGGDEIRQVANEVSLPAAQSNGVNAAAPPQRPPASTLTPSPSPELADIDRQIDSGGFLEAHRALSKLYWSKPELRPTLMPRIEKTAESIYFSPQPHFMDAYVVRSGDLLQNIASRYNVPWEYLARLNRSDPRKIREGQKLKVIKGPFSAVVDLSEFELTVHAHGYFVRRYAVGIGKDGATPIGKFTVLEKVANPQYTDPDGKVFDSDDPANPLGERWIDLGDGYGIHGTIEPDSIGRAESRGCVRMRNAEVEEVYDMLTKGSEVIIRR